MSLKPFVNDKHLWSDFLEELETRISQQHKKMEQLYDEKDLYRTQGEIRALRGLMQLREKVNSGN